MLVEGCDVRTQSRKKAAHRKDVCCGTEGEICSTGQEIGLGSCFYGVGEMEIARRDRVEPYLGNCGWNPEMTIMEALDCLDRYCDSNEAMVHGRQEEQKKQKES
jgi:hypothetical protein